MVSNRFAVGSFAAHSGSCIKIRPEGLGCSVKPLRGSCSLDIWRDSQHSYIGNILFGGLRGSRSHWAVLTFLPERLIPVSSKPTTICFGQY